MGKRAPLSSVRYFSSPWRTDNFLQHLRLQHAAKWKEHEAADELARKEFFDLSADDIVHANTLDAHVDTGESLFFWLRRNIVNHIIGDLLSDPSVCEEKIESALSIFKEDNDTPGTPSSSRIVVSGYEQKELKVTVRKVLAFSLMVDYVAAGVSFRQASHILRSTAELTGLLKLKGVRENEAIMFVRAVVGANLQALAYLLNESECWAYSLAFDGATVQGQAFLDMRVHRCVRREVENIHLLAIPLRGSHTGLQIANVFEAVMIELCGRDWKGKLVGISTDGARNMTGRHSGAVTRLVEGTLSGFFRVWCAAHQLDLAIQDVISGLYGDTFYRALTSCISHLRWQQNLVSAMKTTCPKVASTRCLSLGRVSNWFSKHRGALITHFETKEPAAAPPPTWWIYLLAVQVFMEPVDICFKSMQGQTTVVSEQRVMLRRLVESLRCLLEVEGPLFNERIAANLLTRCASQWGATR